MIDKSDSYSRNANREGPEPSRNMAQPDGAVFADGSLGDALLLAATAHADQTDKSGAPYLTHILRMVEAALTRGCASDVPIVAALHDVVEDTVLTTEDLVVSGFSASVVSAVDALTQRRGESYDEFILRCRDAGPVSRCVKLLDIDDNTRPERMALLDRETRARLTVKYAKARAVLTLPPGTESGGR